MIPSSPEKTGAMLFIALMIFITASILIIFLGFLSYQGQKESIKNAAKQQLTAIADFQVREIGKWREERIGDASVIYNNAAFTSSVHQYFNNSSLVAEKKNILSLLTATQKSNQYENILLLDKNKKIKLAINKYGAGYGEIHSAVVDDAMKRKKIVMSDLHKEKEINDVHLTVAMPVIISNRDTTQPIGTVLIIIDPNRRLFPSIKLWPVPGSTGETLLVHREGNEIVYLNPLRHYKSVPMSIRRSINESNLPAVKAVLGWRGIVEGLDYRQKKVLAAIRPVPDTPWYLVAKIDQEEIYASIVQRFWITLFFVMILVMMLGVIVAYIWRYQQTKLYRKQFELEDKKKSLYARSLIEASLDPLVTINTEGKIMDVNRSTESVTGLSREKLIGSDFSDYFTDPREAADGYKLVFKNGVVRDYPLAIRNISGKVTEVLYNASVYKDDSGVVQGVFAAARDVTEIRVMQKELRKAHDELERRVEERTNELQRANEALELEIRERKEMEKLIELRTRLLEVTNNELESFSYSVSHDLRAPLRAIDGYSRMLLRDQADKLDPDAKRKFELIRSNTQMMGKLIDDLLAFSRLGRLDINMSRLDVESLINDTWKELQIINPDRNLTLNIKNIPDSWGDRTLIRQVYSNLLSNAIKYTKSRDEAHIETGGFIEKDENIYYVKDNGIGFDMNYYNKLFGVFQRLHSADDYEGTGVGLAIVQRIIHRHGGRVWAESKVEEGAVFYFSLQRKG
jgi:PAS domain S-box-containing protein